MAESLEARLSAIEEAVQALTRRIEAVEGRPALDTAERAPRPAPPAAAAPPPAAPEPSLPRGIVPPAARSLDLEDLLGGRVLAWLGGVAVLLGVVFFVVTAVSRGWIDEPTRVVLAFLGSTALLGAGLYLYERRGQTEAALATVAASLAALYASLTAATQLYDLVDPVLGLAIAALVGATGTAIAVRWDSRLVAALGILGALLSPVLVEAQTSGTTLAFMAIALVSAIAVVVWRRWNWLASAAFLISAPQLLFWAHDTYDERLVLSLVVLVAFWALYVVAAIGYELRVPIATLRASSSLLLFGNALLVSVAGYLILSDTDHDGMATAWVIALAIAHVGLGGASLRGRMSREIGSLLIAIGSGLSAVALALALSGPALVAGWSVEAALLAWVARRTGDRRAHLGTAVFLTLAAAHLLTIEAPPDALRDGVDELGTAAVGIAVFAAAALLSARFYDGEPHEWRLVLESAGAAALVYLPSIAIVDLSSRGDAIEPGQTPQVLLSAFWSVTGLAALIYGLVRDDRRFRVGGLALLGVAIVKVFLYDLSELDEIYRVLSFIALGLLLLAAAFAYQRIRLDRRR